MDYLKGVSGIYKITNSSNNKFYIGSSFDVARRITSHFNLLRNGKHPNEYLQNSFNKYGEGSFFYELVEAIDDTSLLLGREQYYIDLLGCTNRSVGYNISPTAGSNVGLKHTDEQRLNNSLAKRGKSAVINEVIASKIKKMLNEGELPNTIAKELSVNKDIVQSIKKGKAWVYVEPQLVELGNLMTTFKNEDIIFIKERLSRGEKVKDIASEYNVSHRTISSIKNGINWSNVGDEIEIKKRRRLSVEEVKEIKRLITEEGKSNKEISEIFGAKRSTISEIRHGKKWNIV